MNEISLNNLAKKIGEDKSFLLVTFAADEEDVEESELVEAFEEVLANKDKVALFVNLGEEAKDEEVLNRLKIEDSPSKSSEEAWQPTKDGFVLIHEGEMVKKSPTTSLEKHSIKATASDSYGHENSFFEYTRNIDTGVTDVLDYMKNNDIRVHH